ncbi:nuclear transport factor 2 family protein [Acinetobacter baumannii]|uniref:nuclear transport factor 2 family protein n=1 Tax=Acinetobacter baumannii TaxID=470 RepID=UPI0029571E85|nr:nuclear transport factor 2 family protein [Acinetobacter baumannii]MDV7495236.1 nuclear transport factor 2 family protein [Acinetobacter baumannii]WNX58954.1 nuclear transport factor 2 family protein [Acinetobacter baumannii]
MEEQVREMEKQRFNSLINKQYDHFAAMCDQNLRYVHTSGTVDDLSAFMNKLQAGYYDYQHIDYDIINVVDMQDCVIVTANFHAKLLVGKQPRTLQNRALSIWKKQQDQLKLMMYQATPFSA